MKVGDVVEFHYDASDPEKERIGKVAYIRDTHKEPLSPETIRRRPDVERSRYIVGCRMSDKTFRAFYSESLTGLHKVGIIRRSLLYLAGVSFETTDHKIDKMGEV